MVKNDMELTSNHLMAAALYGMLTKKPSTCANIYDSLYTSRKMKHQTISFIKSGLRIAGYVMLLTIHIVAAITLLIISEVVGILEEVGHE